MPAAEENGHQCRKRRLKGLSREPINMPRNSHEKANSTTNLPSVGGSSVTKAHLLPEELSEPRNVDPDFYILQFFFCSLLLLSFGVCCFVVVVCLSACLFLFSQDKVSLDSRFLLPLPPS